MKALKLIIIIMVLFLASTMQAQVSVSVNIGSPPMWGPAGYNDVQFYYLPDVEAYYDIHSSMFIYYEGNGWVHRTYLPERYRNYDLYGGYKVVIKDYHGDSPYKNFKEHKSKYGRGYHGGPQKTIGERHGKENQGNGRNAGHINDKGNSHDNGKNMKENKGHGGGNDKKNNK